MEINGECEKHTCKEINKTLMDAIIRRLRNNGAYVSDTAPWTVVTHRSGVVLQGSWDARKETLEIIILKKNFDISCEKIWETITSLINGIRTGTKDLDMDTAV